MKITKKIKDRIAQKLYNRNLCYVGPWFELSEGFKEIHREIVGMVVKELRKAARAERKNREYIGYQSWPY